MKRHKFFLTAFFSILCSIGTVFAAASSSSDDSTRNSAHASDRDAGLFDAPPRSDLHPVKPTMSGMQRIQFVNATTDGFLEVALTQQLYGPGAGRSGVGPHELEPGESEELLVKPLVVTIGTVNPVKIQQYFIKAPDSGWDFRPGDKIVFSRKDSVNRLDFVATDPERSQELILQ